ncbi:MAG TPA: hypothetical protein VGG99_13320 [Acetobacteraceae bacterium]|jgi:hypothetical protein
MDAWQLPGAGWSFTGRTSPPQRFVSGLRIIEEQNQSPGKRLRDPKPLRNPKGHRHPGRVVFPISHVALRKGYQQCRSLPAFAFSHCNRRWYPEHVPTELSGSHDAVTAL